MSVAYYIVLDNDQPGFDTFVNGKFLAKDAEKLDAICEKMGIPKIDDFTAMSEDALADLLDEDIEWPEGEGEQWFTADEGIAFVMALTEHIKANPETLSHPPEVLEDLAEYAEVFAKAKAIGAKWHLNLDM